MQGHVRSFSALFRRLGHTLTGSSSTAFPLEACGSIVHVRIIGCRYFFPFGRFCAQITGPRVADDEQTEPWKLLESSSVVYVGKRLSELEGDTQSVEVVNSNAWSDAFSKQLRAQWHSLSREERCTVCFDPCPDGVQRGVKKFIEELSFSEKVDVYEWTLRFGSFSIRARDPWLAQTMLKDFSSVSKSLHPSCVLRAFRVCLHYNRRDEELFKALSHWLLTRSPDMTLDDLCRLLTLYWRRHDGSMGDSCDEEGYLSREVDSRVRSYSLWDALKLGVCVIRSKSHVRLAGMASPMETLEKRVEKEWQHSNINDCCPVLFSHVVSKVARDVCAKALLVLWTLNLDSLVYLIAYLAYHKKIGHGDQDLHNAISPLVGNVKYLENWHVALLAERLSGHIQMREFHDQHLFPEFVEYFERNSINMTMGEVVCGTRYLLRYAGLLGSSDLLLQLQRRIASNWQLLKVHDAMMYVSALRYGRPMTAPAAAYLDSFGGGKFCDSVLNISRILMTLHSLCYGPPVLLAGLAQCLHKVLRQKVGSSAPLSASDLKRVCDSLVALAWLSGPKKPLLDPIIKDLSQLLSPDRLLLVSSTVRSFVLWAFMVMDKPLILSTSILLSKQVSDCTPFREAQKRLDLHWYARCYPELNIQPMANRSERKCVEIMRVVATNTMRPHLFGEVWGVSGVQLQFGLWIWLALLLNIRQMCFTDFTERQVPQSPGEMLSLRVHGLYPVAIMSIRQTNLIKPKMTMPGFWQLKYRQLLSLGWIPLNLSEEKCQAISQRDVEMLTHDAVEACSEVPKLLPGYRDLEHFCLSRRKCVR